MAFQVRLSPLAKNCIEEFAVHVRGYSQEFAVEHIDRLGRILSEDLAAAPMMCGYLPFTGAPYRGTLFRGGRRTQYWVVYTVDEEARTVDVLHFWHAGRDPDSLDL